MKCDRCRPIITEIDLASPTLLQVGRSLEGRISQVVAASGRRQEEDDRMASIEKLPMLAEGYERITAELKALREERPRIVDAIEEARAHGDLSENAEYHAAKERQGHIEASIADLEDKVSRAQIIDPATLSGDKIIFGATVSLLDEDDKPVRYQIVGPYEADAKVGRISYNSPLGKALIGRKVDDEIEVTVPAGDKFYLVRKIEFI